MTDEQIELLNYLRVLRQGAVDALMMAAMFFAKMEREALPAAVAIAYDQLSADQVDEVIKTIIQKENLS